MPGVSTVVVRRLRSLASYHLVCDRKIGARLAAASGPAVARLEGVTGVDSGRGDKRNIHFMVDDAVEVYRVPAKGTGAFLRLSLAGLQCVSWLPGAPYERPLGPLR